jgi:SH3-like domain-containing protein
MRGRLAFALGVAVVVGQVPPAMAQLGGPRIAEGAEHCVIDVATSDALNVRQQPSADAQVLGTHAYGDCGIVVTGPCADGWCPVDDGTVAGWVSARYISVVEPPFFCVGLFWEGPLPLRAFPSEQSRVVVDIPNGDCDIAALPYGKGGWIKVRWSGHEGWVEYQHLYAQ